VARRLAHEIKNPLTPIQLSAERMEFKLEDKLEGADRALLIKSVHTIVDQVAAMQRLVNEFRDYARLPAARLAPLQLNDLIAETMHLYASASVPVAAECDSACPPIMGDAQQLQQVIHNLVQNAQDATEQAGASEDGAPRAGVIIRTQWLPDVQRVRMSIIDHGPGFSPDLLKRIFEPYVTTKAKGTGLGLPVVKKIASEHGARIDVGNRTAADGSVEGAQVVLTFEAAPAAPSGAPSELHV
ncbi:MAG: PAS domain-containing sensor histidine kinase, partial [Ottowia sp.]|nr:PAS domain-containing sensor histidine kinase [Ottowia sp.]